MTDTHWGNNRSAFHDIIQICFMEELFQVNPSIFHRPGRLPGFVDQVFPHWDMLLKFVAGQISVALVEALGQNM